MVVYVTVGQSEGKEAREGSKSILGRLLGSRKSPQKVPTLPRHNQVPRRSQGVAPLGSGGAMAAKKPLRAFGDKLRGILLSSNKGGREGQDSYQPVVLEEVTDRDSGFASDTSSSTSGGGRTPAKPNGAADELDRIFRNL